MSETATLPLAESLDMNAAGPLAQALCAERGHAVQLDAAAVRRIGGQCLQVLLAAEAAWAADGQAFEIVNASTEFAEGTVLMGAPHLSAGALGAPAPVQD
jgi:chemotaxis protein CheX